MKKVFSAGNVALALCLLITCAWTAWGVIEMFHEGWYAPFEWLFFLLPAGVCLALTLFALAWPRLGGYLLIAIGIGSYAWLLGMTALRFGPSLTAALRNLPVSGLLALIGVLFLREARQRKRTARPREPRWWRRNLPSLLAVGVPLLLGVSLALEPAHRVANRVDDGDYGARRIRGNGVDLTWASAGPGWQRGVTWNQIALYGLPPVGLEGKSSGRGECRGSVSAGCATADDMARYNICLFLSRDGSRLEETVQGFWRMPTTEEIVRSLVRHGENARCTWNGRTGKQPCGVTPDKETPLWNPRSPIIYLWSAEEADAGHAYYVTYNGAVYVAAKSVGMDSRGYRCVREAEDRGQRVGEQTPEIAHEAIPKAGNRRER